MGSSQDGLIRRQPRAVGLMASEAHVVNFHKGRLSDVHPGLAQDGDEYLPELAEGLLALPDVEDHQLVRWSERAVKGSSCRATRSGRVQVGDRLIVLSRRHCLGTEIDADSHGFSPLRSLGLSS